MATNETPATIKPGYYTDHIRHHVHWVSEKGVVSLACACEGLTSEGFTSIRPDRITHAEARAILGDKYPATWPQCDAPATGQGGPRAVIRCMTCGEDRLGNQRELAAKDATIRELREALRPVIDDVNKHTPSVFTDDNWNPTHQIEVGLTVGELKAMYTALRAAGGEH